MRLRQTENEEIKLNMTSMIDIVFQLLVFFVMTFKVTAMEGDFSIKMPLASQTEDVIDDILPEQIDIRLVAGENGVISRIIVDNDTVFTDENMFNSLTSLIEEMIAAEGDPEEGADTEVQFDIDYNLKYSYTVKAIESVSGRVQSDGTIKKLIEKVKFKDNTNK
ncbi:MAG: biopolymer transporter ExbD [Planctomycetota bacterium]